MSGGHHHDDHSHDHGTKGAVSASASVAVETKAGYGRDIPTPPLAIDLKAEVKETKETKETKGYPRENPSNPLKLDPQAATKVEVRVDSATTAAPMMGGEIPGNAGTDYPIFDTIPETKFNCKDQATGGYYADVDEGRCQVRFFKSNFINCLFINLRTMGSTQVFHVCHDGRKFSFLCPNGTIFDQKVFVCNWWFNVDCAASKDFYNLNAAIGVVPEKPSGANSEPQTSASVVDTQQVANPNLEYLPPVADAKQPVKAVEKPTTSYLPPQVAPNVVEALSNGIITSTAPPAPAQSYLPPENY